jgi:DNA repair exonuclease SbcCD nuclease subunit
MSSLTCIAIGDPHFKTDNVVFTDEFVDKALPLIRQKNPDFIVVLGDILDRHALIHVNPLERSIRFLKKLSEIAPLYVLIGNHDRPNNSNFLTTEHPFNALKYWNSTKIVDVGLIDTIKNRKFIFLPYVPPGRFFEALATLFSPKEKKDTLLSKYQEDVEKIKQDLKIDKKTSLLTETEKEIYRHRHKQLVEELFSPSLNDITAVFAHQEFYGAKMGAIVSTEGDEWPLSFPFVISGHVHDYHYVQDNLLYIGTPLSHASNDHEIKTLSYFSWTFDNSRPVEERIDLNLTKRIVVTIPWDQVATYVPPPKHFVKLIITGTSAELKTVLKVQNIKTLTAMGVKIAYKNLPSPLTEVSQQQEQHKMLGYKARLYQAVSQNPELKNTFVKLFGNLSLDPTNS